MTQILFYCKFVSSQNMSNSCFRTKIIWHKVCNILVVLESAKCTKYTFMNYNIKILN